MVIPYVALALTLLLRFGPDVPVLRALRAAMVEVPARRLAQLQHHHIIFLIVLSAMMLAGGQLLVFFGPEFLALFATNLALYVDAAAITALLSAATVARQAVGIIRPELNRWRTFVGPTVRRAVREVKTRPLAAKPAADNDDDPAQILRALAA